MTAIHHHLPAPVAHSLGRAPARLRLATAARLAGATWPELGAALDTPADTLRRGYARLVARVAAEHRGAQLAAAIADELAPIEAALRADGLRIGGWAREEPPINTGRGRRPLPRIEDARPYSLFDHLPRTRPTPEELADLERVIARCRARGVL